MSLRGGLGDVTSNNLLLTPVAEKLTAIKHRNNKDYWVLTHGLNNNTFYAYLVTKNGVSSTPVLSNVGSTHVFSFPINGAAGYMKASPNGKLLAVSTAKQVELFDLDNSTGIVSDKGITFTGYGGFGSYGVEFSPNNKILYVSSWDGNIHQYDLLAGAPSDIIASKVVVGYASNTMAVPVSQGYGELGTLQLGPDGKIYVAQKAYTYVGIIHEPCELGTACNYEEDGIYLNGSDRRCYAGLPQFVQSFFYYLEVNYSYTDTCYGDSTYFTLEGDTIDCGPRIDSVLWDFNDPISGSANSSLLFEPAHLFSDSGTYDVQLIVYKYDRSPDTIIKTIYIERLLSSPDLGNDTTICQGRSVELDAGPANGTYLWPDNSDSQQFNINSEGIYWVQVSNSCGNERDTIIITTETCTCDLFIPNVFTPNNDDINEDFIIRTDCNFSMFDLKIYARWGKLMFHSTNPNNTWNGNVKSGIASSAVYIWMVEYLVSENVEGAVISEYGNVTLIK